VVLFTPGCKDYGPGLLKNDPYLSPHTELLPLNPPPSLANRANYAIKTFENGDYSMRLAVRPANVYGYLSSYYAFFFRIAEARERAGEWVVSERRGRYCMRSLAPSLIPGRRRAELRQIVLRLTSHSVKPREKL
jgi:hypothetical protein